MIGKLTLNKVICKYVCILLYIFVVPVSPDSTFFTLLSDIPLDALGLSVVSLDACEP